MRILIVHLEAAYYAGAERVLEHFLHGLAQTGAEATVAIVEGSKVQSAIPEKFERIALPNNQQFGWKNFWRQVQALRRAHSARPFQLAHGWAARDWESIWALKWLESTPALGTLHDDPRASFISPKRQTLMKLAAQFGLTRVACVSQAVQNACLRSGYPADKLRVVHNGLPDRQPPSRVPHAGPLRLGFLGAFSERKGLRLLMEILDLLPPEREWTLQIGGGAQDAAAEQLVQNLISHFQPRPWWSRLQWPGWVKNPADFLAELDLLIVPSTTFDPFPTVLLEAGQAGAAVLAADVGGVSEIVESGRTGWLFPPGNAALAANQIEKLLANPRLAFEAGEAARARVASVFTLSKMVEEYSRIYSTIASNG